MCCSSQRNAAFSSQSCSSTKFRRGRRCRGRKPCGRQAQGLALEKICGEGAREAAEKAAAELIKIYAEREVSKGFAFPENREMMRELEESFPYKETADQLRAIEEVERTWRGPCRWTA